MPRRFARSSSRPIRRVGTLLSTSLDAGVDLRDVQIAARHADPRTTMRYDNSRELHQAGEKPQVSRHGRAGIAFRASGRRRSDQARLASRPS